MRATLASFSFALLAALALAALAQDADADVTLDTGAVTLGIRDDGSLGVCCGAPSLGGYATVGLRLDSNQAEGLTQGCVCEGWAVEHSGGAGHASHSSTSGVTGVSLATTAAGAFVTSATSTAMVGDLRVQHAFAPSAATADLVRVDVTLTNTGVAPLGPVAYRRSVDFDAEPTPFREYISMRSGTLPPEFEKSCSNGFALSIASDPDPCAGIYVLGPPGGADFADAGPSDHGAMLQLRAGSLAPGASWTFQLYFGATPTEAAADTAVGAVGAVWYAYAQSDTTGGPTAGTPATFILAWAGSGTPPPPPPPPCTGAPPAVITDLAATIRGTRATLTWSTPAPGDCPIRQIRIEARHPSATGYAFVGAVTPSATTHDVTVYFCTASSFRILARSEAGDAPYGYGKTTVVPEAPPTPPYILAADHNATANRLYWYPPYSAAGTPCAPTAYEVYRDGALHETVPHAPGTYSTIYYDEPVANCSRHTYHVVAMNSHGRSGMSPGAMHQHRWYLPGGAQMQCAATYCVGPTGTAGTVCPKPAPPCSPVAGTTALGQEGLVVDASGSQDGLRLGYTKSPEDADADAVEGGSATVQPCGLVPPCMAGRTHAKLGFLGLDLHVDWETGTVTLGTRDGGPTDVKDNAKPKC